MFYNDPNFWVLVSFVIFVALVWWKARKTVAGTLDARIQRIQAELDEVHQLKQQAQDALAEQRQRSRQAKEEIKKIEERARAEASFQARAAEEKYERSIAQRRELATQRIAQAEAAAMKAISERTVELSMRAAQQILEQQMQGKVGQSAINAAIKDVAAVAKKSA